MSFMKFVLTHKQNVVVTLLAVPVYFLLGRFLLGLGRVSLGRRSSFFRTLVAAILECHCIV